MIDDDQKKKQEIQKKLNEVRNTERQNIHGLMEGSTLTATIIEARELATPSAYVIIKNTMGDSQKQQSELIHSADPA